MSDNELISRNAKLSVDIIQFSLGFWYTLVAHLNSVSITLKLGMIPGMIISLGRMLSARQLHQLAFDNHAKKASVLDVSDTSHDTR